MGKEKGINSDYYKYWN